MDMGFIKEAVGILACLLLVATLAFAEADGGRVPEIGSPSTGVVPVAGTAKTPGFQAP